MGNHRRLACDGWPAFVLVTALLLAARQGMEGRGLGGASWSQASRKVERGLGSGRGRDYLKGKQIIK